MINFDVFQAVSFALASIMVLVIVVSCARWFVRKVTRGKW